MYNFIREKCNFIPEYNEFIVDNNFFTKDKIYFKNGQIKFTLDKIYFNCEKMYFIHDKKKFFWEKIYFISGKIKFHSWEERREKVTVSGCLRTYLTFTVEYFPVFDDVSSQQPSLNRKKIEISQSFRIFKILKTINSFCSSRLQFSSNFMSDIYSKFQSHEPNYNKGLMWLTYKVYMNSLERQSIEFSKLWTFLNVFKLWF